MTKKIKPNVADLATKRGESQQRLDDALAEVAGDLQRAFDNLGVNMKVDFQRKPKGRTS